MVPPLATLARGDPARGKLAEAPDYGRGRRLAARLSTWPPTVMPICAISPAACSAVVTSSGPLGGAAGRDGSRGGSGGRGGDGRAARRWGFSAVAARDAAVERVPVGFGLAAAVARGCAASRRPSRSRRVEGRLASTPADFLLLLGFAGLSVIRVWIARLGT